MRKNKNLGQIYYKQLSYIKDNYAKEDVLLKNIRNQCLMDNKAISINPEEGKFLQFLIKSHNIKSIIEIGTLYGYSTVWQVRALPMNGEIITIEKNKYNFNMANKNFNLLENNKGDIIKTINNDAEIELNKLTKENKQYDMMFIDAEKSKYINYLKLSDKLIKKNGLIVADNTFLSGGVYLDYLPNRVTFTAQKNMRKFNRELANSNKYFTIMLNTEEGLSVAIKLF